MRNSTFFKKKSITTIIEESESKDGLQRKLSAINLVALGIGVIVGTGIFVITGTAAANYAGPALTLSFIVSGFSCVMAAMCYAEFAAMMPVSGSAYAYSYTTLGEGPAWFIGWMLVLEYLFAAAIVSVGWSSYMVSLLSDFGISLPSHICEAPFDYVTGTGWVTTGGLINFPAMFIIGLLAVCLLNGITQSARVNNIIVVVKVAVILVFIGVGAAYIDTSNWTPYIPENTGTFGEFGWSGIFRGAGVIFFAYLGFDAMSTAAQEAKNPQKDMPKGIIISLLICTVLYIAVTAVLTGIVNYKELGVVAPIALAIDRTGITWLSPMVKIGAIAGITSVILVLILAQSRLYYSMSKDGLLPRFFGRVNKHKSPNVSTIIAAVVTALLAGLSPIHVLSELVSIGTLVAFTSVCISVLILRKTQPDVHRPFKTPWVPFIPILGALVCVGQMLSLPGATWSRLMVWFIIGVGIYVFYGRKNSKLKNL